MLRRCCHRRFTGFELVFWGGTGVPRGAQTRTSLHRLPNSLPPSGLEFTALAGGERHFTPPPRGGISPGYRLISLTATAGNFTFLSPRVLVIRRALRARMISTFGRFSCKFTPIFGRFSCKFVPLFGRFSCIILDLSLKLSKLGL